MLFGEKLYLAGTLFVFASFIALIGTLSWLDAKDERIRRRRERVKQSSSAKQEAFVTGAAARR